MKKSSIIPLVACSIGLAVSLYDICNQKYFAGIIGCVFNVACICLVLVMERRIKKKSNKHNILIERLFSQFKNSARSTYIPAADIDKNVIKKMIDHLAAQEEYETCATLQKIIDGDSSAENIRLRFDDSNQTISFFKIK